METTEALEIVEGYKNKHGHVGTLEAMQAMKIDEDLTPRERAGFNVAFDGFRRLFYGDEA